MVEVERLRASHLSMRGQRGARGAVEAMPAAAACRLCREQQCRHRRLVVVFNDDRGRDRVLCDVR
jgi:hypothetical protein